MNTMSTRTGRRRGRCRGRTLWIRRRCRSSRVGEGITITTMGAGIITIIMGMSTVMGMLIESCGVCGVSFSSMDLCEHIKITLNHRHIHTNVHEHPAPCCSHHASNTYIASPAV